MLLPLSWQTYVATSMVSVAGITCSVCCVYVRYQLGGGAVVWKPQHQNFQVERLEAGNRLYSSDVYEVV